jgi:para-nitrobenzyl esterase
MDSGTAAVPVQNGANLAKRGAVVVTLNYRLGIFGFYASPELSTESPEHVSGNQGILDQIAALRWIRTNIASFGGDPDRVTIMGNSAGGESVALLVASPLGERAVSARHRRERQRCDADQPRGRSPLRSEQSCR